jgi:2'-5' RNA ligase
MPRLFLAIAIPDPVADSLDRVREPMKYVRWIPREQLHLTLKFIGDVDNTFAHNIGEAVSRVKVRPFLLACEKLGVFPVRGSPQVLWADVGAGHPHLFALQKHLEDTCFRLGIEPEKRRYRPHVSLARIRSGADEIIRQFLKKHPTCPTPPFRVDRFALYRSDPGPRGIRTYTAVRTVDLHEP